jgi:hypothetical protein
MVCTNSAIGYANPDAVTQIAVGLSTTTYAYHNNGNLIPSGNAPQQPPTRTIMRIA